MVLIYHRFFILKLNNVEKNTYIKLNISFISKTNVEQLIVYLIVNFFF